MSPAEQSPTDDTSTESKAQSESPLESEAESGDAAAQFSLGYRYDHAGDYDQALKWYRKGADQGYALAQSALGSMYQMGRGVPQNFGEALKWYLLALKQADPVAESNLGLMSARGQGTKLGEALKLFEKSAEKGWPPAQANLAYLYTVDPSKDLVRAYMWCTLALASGQEDAKRRFKIYSANLVGPISIFLPRKTSPPFQTVVYFPAAGAIGRIRFCDQKRTGRDVSSVQGNL
jgi:TPR repeat protein